MAMSVLNCGRRSTSSSRRLIDAGGIACRKQRGLSHVGRSLSSVNLLFHRAEIVRFECGTCIDTKSAGKVWIEHITSPGVIGVCRTWSLAVTGHVGWYRCRVGLVVRELPRIAVPFS